MKASLEADFGEMVISPSLTGEGLGWGKTLLSSSMKKIKKPQRNEIKILLTKFLDSYIASTTFDSEDNLTQDLLSELQKRYHLTSFPYQIECIDISHLSGSYVSGGLSCMREWLLYKPWYRHYKIKLLEDNKSNYSNDFLSLQEIIVRRFNLKWKDSPSAPEGDLSDRRYPAEQAEGLGWGKPDLFILDGGKWQLNTVLELCQIFPSLKEIMKTTTFISLGKGKARKESAKSQWEQEKVYYIKTEIVNWKLLIANSIEEIPLLYDTADLILTKLRDEAHRFANKYRTTRMSKERK
jgi:excinuclease UvrABC nuclease subunit